MCFTKGCMVNKRFRYDSKLVSRYKPMDFLLNHITSHRSSQRDGCCLDPPGPHPHYLSRLSFRVELGPARASWTILLQHNGQRLQSLTRRPCLILVVKYFEHHLRAGWLGSVMQPILQVSRVIRALTWIPALDTVPRPCNKTLLGTCFKHNHNGAPETSAHLWRRDSLEAKSN